MLLLAYTPHTTDTRIYFRWLSQAAAGRLPLVDFPIEYPPLAWWVMQVPAAASQLAYQFRFRTLMLGADVVSFAILAWIVSKRRATRLTAFAFIYTLAPLILAHELYDRLDMGVLLLAALALAAWLAAFDLPGSDGARAAAPDYPKTDGREWNGWAAWWGRAGWWLAAAYVAVGLGTGLKLFPAIIAVFFVLSELLTRRRLGSLALRLGLLAAVVAMPLAITFLSAGTHAFDFLRYHGARGLELGSTWASLMWLLSRIGYRAEIAIRFGSWELVGPAEPVVLQAASVAAFLVPLVLAAWAILLGRRFDGCRAYVHASLAFCSLLIVSKVFSPQFLIWGIPVIALVAVEVCDTRLRFAVSGAALVVCSALTTLVYQGGGSGAIIHMPSWLMLALLGRNLIYVSLWVYLAVLLARRDWSHGTRRSQ